MKITLYTPVVQEKQGDCFLVNGATNEDRDRAISLARRHSAFTDPETKIIRVDQQ